MKKPTGPTKQEGPIDKEIFGTWIAGYNAGNVEQVMSIFDPSLRYERAAELSKLSVGARHETVCAPRPAEK